MPWWKSSSGAHNHHLLPSASTSSSSSSTPPRSGGSARGGRFMDSCFFPWSWWDAHPRLTRERKLRHLNDIDIEALCLEEPAYEDAAGFVSVSRPSSHIDVVPSRSASSPMLLPHPLPLPKGALHRETASSRVLGCSPPNTQGCPLPSPFGSSGKVEGDDGNETASEHTDLQPVVGSGLAQQTNLRSPQQVDKPTNKKTISHRRKLSQDSKFSGIVDFRLNIPSKSVPVSQLSSPVGSPRRSGNVDSPATAMGIRGFQGWSATEILMTAYCSQNSPDKKIYSPERSSLSSPPTKNTTLRSRNSSAPPSPLQTKMFPESTAAWHDNGGNLNVHPLPLPPGPSPSQSAFAYHTAAKSEDSLKTSQWQKGKLIGSGTFGTVYEATNRHNGSLCAMKEVNIIPDDPKSAECLKQLEQEIKCLSQFKHPNIVQYYGSETIGDQLYIYLEYVHPGSINKYVRQYCGAMTESVVRCFTRHILNGLIYLHSKNIVHRDIKGANLLVDVKGVVKLADFGMAKHLSGAAPARSLKGSPFWMAPELMKELNELGKDSFEKTCFALRFSALSRMLQATMNKEIGYDLSVDIWSLGCTIIEMFTGKHPWSDLEGPQAMFKVLHTDPPIPESLSNDGKDFLHFCFRRNPAERPTATKLLDHPFVRNSNHQNHHANLHPSAGIKFDNTISLRDRNRSKSEPSVLKKNFSARENHQSYPELCDSAAPRPSRSNFDVIPSSSQNGMQYGAGNLQSYVLPKPHNKETQVLPDIK